MNNAQKLVEVMGQVAKALQDLKETGLPRRIIIMVVMEKTKLAEKTVTAVINAIEETAAELLQPANGEGIDTYA